MESLYRGMIKKAKDVQIPSVDEAINKEVIRDEKETEPTSERSCRRGQDILVSLLTHL